MLRVPLLSDQPLFKQRESLKYKNKKVLKGQVVLYFTKPPNRLQPMKDLKRVVYVKLVNKQLERSVAQGNHFIVSAMYLVLSRDCGVRP